MRPGGAGAYRGAYPSAAYDSAYWTDPFNPHFRPDPAAGDGGPPRGGSATGWGNKGMIGTNGGIFLALLSLTVSGKRSAESTLLNFFLSTHSSSLLRYHSTPSFRHLLYYRKIRGMQIRIGAE